MFGPGLEPSSGTKSRHFPNASLSPLWDFDTGFLCAEFLGNVGKERFERWGLERTGGYLPRQQCSGSVSLVGLFSLLPKVPR